MSHDTDYMRSSWSTIITVFTILNWLDGQLFQHLYDIIAIKIGSLMVFFRVQLSMSIGIGFMTSDIRAYIWKLQTIFIVAQLWETHKTSL